MTTTTIFSEIENRPKLTLTNPAKILETHGEEVSRLRNHIQNLTPFECDNFSPLLLAIYQQYSDSWKIKLPDILDCIGTWDAGIKSVYPKYMGSWNCPIRWVRDLYKDEEHNYYKVLRKNTISQKTTYQYEFHNSLIPKNEWIQAEISSSNGLYGLKKREEGGMGGRFHLLLDYLQAQTYLSKRIDDTWFPKTIATIVPVRARKFQSIDLIYVPPTTFVWGIDSDEILVNYEYTV